MTHNVPQIYSGLNLLRYEIDNSIGGTDACHYEDPMHPGITTIEVTSSMCKKGVFRKQAGHDVCLIEPICPQGTISQAGGMCSVCSSLCTAEHIVRSEPIPVLFVLDSSGSMVKGTDAWRWPAAIQSIEDIMLSEDSYQYGLQLFPGRFGICSIEDIAVPIGPDTTAEIINTMNSRRPDGNTPLVDVLTAAYEEGFSQFDKELPKLLVLVTDGYNTCLSDPNEALALARDSLQQKNIQTFVISLDNNIDPFLVELAAAGGTSRVRLSTNTQSITSNIQQSLATASCRFSSP